MKKITLLIGVLTVVGCIGTANGTGITVPSAPLWTDTGIFLMGCADITATGTWNWGNVDPSFGPNGDFLGPSGFADEWLPNGFHGQLIAFVGPDPYAGRISPQTYYPIGSSGSLKALTGELWLGFNDDFSTDATGDNTGSVTADVKLIIPDGGSTLVLLGGVVVLAGAFRRFVRN